MGGGDGSSVLYRPLGWRGQKLFWYVLPRYQGCVLLRGRRLDCSEWMRSEPGDGRHLSFESGRVRPYSGRDSHGEPRGPSGVRFRASGCYGVQIDGAGFSRMVIFRVTLSRA